MGAFDQRVARVTASAAVTNSRSRIHSVAWTGVAGASQVTFTDGNGGATVAVFDFPAGAGGSGQIYIAEESGILFHSSIFCSAITAGVFLNVCYSQ